MRIKALKTFASTSLGNVDEGRVFDTSDAHARHLIENGLCKEIEASYGTKVVREVPTEAGEAKPYGASRRGRRSRKTTAKGSEDGESSPSTPASD